MSWTHPINTSLRATQQDETHFAFQPLLVGIQMVDFLTLCLLVFLMK